MKIKDLLRDYGMAVQLVERAKIKANAVVITLPDSGYLVFLDRGLPANIQLFSLAHEAAHIDLGLIRPGAGYPADVEKRVDLRALELLSDAVLPEMRAELAGKCAAQDNSFYDCLASREVFTGEALRWAAELCK